MQSFRQPQAMRKESFRQMRKQPQQSYQRSPQRRAMEKVAVDYFGENQTKSVPTSSIGGFSAPQIPVDEPSPVEGFISKIRGGIEDWAEEQERKNYDRWKKIKGWF